MLLILLYHRINAGKYSNRLDTFERHIKFIAEHYPVVLPGDPLPSGRLSVCLTFDDAYFDFYHYVFPLLCELKIRALLGVPVRYIVENTTIDSITRLSVSCDEAMINDTFQQKAPFCTWDEISQMVASSFVEVASHSYSHKNLTEQDVDLSKEIISSKAILEKKLPQKITTFIYPFGKVNKKVHSFVIRHLLTRTDNLTSGMFAFRFSTKGSIHMESPRYLRFITRICLISSKRNGMIWFFLILCG